MGVSLCIASGKGGVGKTFVAVNLAVSLAKEGVKTIAVDGSLEIPNMGLALGIDTPRNTLHGILSKKCQVSEAVVEHESGLHVIPGEPSLGGIEGLDHSRFQGLISHLAESYDVVVADSQPGYRAESLLPLAACSKVVVVCTPTIISISEAMKVAALADEMGREVLGVIVNQVRGEPLVTDAQIEELLGLQIIGKIPYDENVDLSFAWGSPLVISKPAADAARAFSGILTLLLGEDYRSKRLERFVEDVEGEKNAG